MKKMNNKGFTLIELSVVLFLLIILITFGITKFSSLTKKNYKKAFADELQTFYEASLNKRADDRLNNDNTSDMYNSYYNYKVCYNIKDSLVNKYVSKDSKKYDGSIEVCYGDGCTYNAKIWLTNGDLYADGVELNGDEISPSVLKKSYTTQNPNTCGVDLIATVGLTKEYDFSGEYKTFTSPRDGVYSFELWGAQGGNSGTYRGGYGAYAYTEIKIKKGQKVYINVGGQGENYNLQSGTVIEGFGAGGSGPNPKGGYNGGGEGNSSFCGAGGGGATSVAFKDDFPNINFMPQDMIAVAGGGGGAKACEHNIIWYGHSDINNGYSGGGDKPENGHYNVSTQSIYANAAYTNMGIGGYMDGGGYVASTYGEATLGQGGGGYIGHKDNHNAVMYGYNVEENNDPKYLTHTTNQVSEIAESQKAKIGNGYAIIKYLGDNFSS